MTVSNSVTVSNSGTAATGLTAPNDGKRPLRAGRLIALMGCALAPIAAAQAAGGADVTLPQGFAMQPRAVVAEARAIAGTPMTADSDAEAGVRGYEPPPTRAAAERFTGLPAAPAPAPAPAADPAARFTAPAPVATVAPPALATAPQRAVRTGLPAQLTAEQREAYRAVFSAIRVADWSGAAARLDAMGSGPLHAVARDELYLAKGSPRVETDPLVTAIAAAPELPQAVQLARLAGTRGATTLPGLPYARDLVRMEQAPRRRAAQTTRSDSVAASLSARATTLVKNDQPADAEALLNAVSADLSSDARTEWQQRIAWAYFLGGNDADARRLAAQAQAGSGEWAVQADWVAGLAAWRGHDCDAAGSAFQRVAARARDPEMTAAGLFWSARAEMACGHPQLVQTRLRSAARLTETFYGLLAGGALGQAVPAAQLAIDPAQADWPTIAQRANLRTAVALAEVGELGLADALIRHQARIGSATDHGVLVDLAAGLSLPATQIWLAQNGPAGTRLAASARYPTPGWAPQGGWRVDKSLVYAHALQESQFRTGAASGAGAQGLMQVMPGTAALVAKKRGMPFDRSRLNEPAVNMEYGQSYLEQLRDGVGTGGLLPKVIAAYNCGPMAVARWNERGRNLADPLLFIEAIPYAETRAYVAIVLRNYWMYQRNAGTASASLKAIAQGLWPRFPGMPGKQAVRVDAVGAIASIN